MPVKITRRHLTVCPHKRKGRTWTHQCNCPLQADGTLANGYRVKRKFLKTTSMEAAQTTVRGWEEHGSDNWREIKVPAPSKPDAVPIVEAIGKFLQHWKSNRRVAEGTLYLYRCTFLKPTTKKRPNAQRMMTLEAFCEKKGIVYIQQVTLDDLQELQREWGEFEESTINQKTIYIKTLWSFLVRKGLSSIDLTEPTDLPLVDIPRDAKTKPFELEEMQAIVAAATNPMDKALVLFMRYSGFRILDATTSSVTDIQNGNQVGIRQKKVIRGNNPVVVELPDIVLDALNQFKRKSDLHWFWDGRQSFKDLRQHWYKRLKKVFVEAGVPDGHPHMLRDTFAVENLLMEGSDVKSVSMSLGHSSVVTTEKHYLFWVKRRQARLDNQIRKAHMNDPLLRELEKERVQGRYKVSTFPAKKSGS